MYSVSDESKEATAERLRQLLVERGVPPEVIENFRFHAELAEYAGFASPGMVSDYVFGVVPLDVLAATKFADYLGCDVRRFSEELQRQIDRLSQYSYEVVTQSELAEARGKCLKELASVIPKWLGPGHEAVKQALVSRVRSAYAGAEPPEELEGIRTGLDFFGVLKWHGSDHGLYLFSMNALDADIRQEVRSLGAEDQIALLLPLCRWNVEELVAEQSVEDWPEILLKHYWDQWEEPLRDSVLECVVARNPHDLAEATGSSN